MNIVVAGGSGFIGSRLVADLLARGNDVVVLTRDPARAKQGRAVTWRPPTVDEGLLRAIERASVVVNLAGESIGDGRWTARRKQELVSSRLEPTAALVEALSQAGPAPRVFISTSAVGFYGTESGDEVLDESASAGSGFLADLTQRWEAAAAAVGPAARLVILRFGVVLGRGGALPRMLLPFRLGAGGPVGRGTQWMSWVAIDDVVRAIEWSIDSPDARGVYNVTAPEPVRNRDFARAAGRALHRPAFLPAPALALRLALGEMADELLLGGQRAIPARLQREGFTFAHSDIERTIRDIAGRRS